MRILALVTDAFGGHGGIAKFNRDLLAALCGQSDVEQVIALPRLLAEPPGKLPLKLEYRTSGVGGKLRFVVAVLKSALRTPRSELIICGHINLLPLAFVARWFCRAPITLVIHGIDAWQPTRSRLVNRLVRKVDAVLAVSEFTRKKFWAWAQPERARYFILPNCVYLAQFTPGAKSPNLLRRYGLDGKTVLLTVARLSASERYKGIDEVMEVVPELSREIPEIAYLIVGDGTDRTRLEQKAVQLGLQGRVVFAGRIAEREQVEHFRLADAFVMPGWGEGFGIVYLEAMACGVPVLASTEDASAEVVADCDAAAAVNPHDPAAVRAGVIRILKLQWSRGPRRTAKVEFYSNVNFQQRVGKIIRQLSEVRHE